MIAPAAVIASALSLAGPTGAGAAPVAAPHAAAPSAAPAIAPPAAQRSPQGGKPAHDARMRWWREARFGMFIHWGLYSEAAGHWNGKSIPGVGEWILTHGRIPVAEYESLQDRFDPVDFDAEAWVALAKRAGMRYIVITSKHHDGFCLWPSERTEWDIASTPFGKRGRDPLGELYRACEAAGIRLCLYHSIMDWHHPDYLPRRAWDTRPSEGAQFDHYREYLRGQLAELLKRYPNIGVLWFDGEWEETWTHEHGRELHDWLRIQAPALIINNRIDKGRDGMAGLTRGSEFRGDFGTPEQEIPEHGFPEGVDWESCMTMNDTWGFKRDDRNWKSSETIIRMLVECASKGGNFLLNVGPDGRGRIPKESVERLEAVGRWLEPRREAVYGTRASPFGALRWGRCTQGASSAAESRLYLFVFETPRDLALRLPGIVNSPNGAWLLGGQGDRLRVDRDEDALIVQLPSDLEGPVPVVALSLGGALRFVAPPSIGARSAQFVDTITVRLDGAGAGETIRYTLDGTEPTAASPEAGGAVTLDRSCTVSARTFEGETPRSGTAVRSFARVTPARALEREPALQPGLRVTMLERDRFERLSDLASAAVKGAVVVPTLSLEARPVGERFGAVFEGFIRIPDDGVWHFGLESDDGARVFIGDRLVVENDGLHAATRRDAEVALAEGLHPIRVEYFNAGGDRALRLDWEGPDQARSTVPASAFGWAP